MNREPKRKRLNLPLAIVPMSNKEENLRETNRAIINSFNKNIQMQDPYLIAEEILESIIEEGHPVEEIVNLFHRRISEYRK